MAKRRLKSLNDVRRFLADVINRLEAGTLDASVAGRLGYLCNVLKGLIEHGDLENRIANLERLAERGGCEAGE